MLRIALILALLAAIGSLALSQLVTKPTVDDLRGNLERTEATLKTTEGTLATTKTELGKTKKDLDEKAKDLDATKQSLETVSTEAANLKKRSDKLDADLSKATSERNAAQATLAQWEVLGVTPGQVTQIRVDLKKATEDRTALQDEKTIFIRDIARLNNELAKYIEPDTKVKLPDGLKGTILEVGPQGDFVLLDIGEAQGVLTRGELLVRRGDKLVGKVRIVKVDANRSIGNLLPAWKQGDVAVAKGDQVLY